MVGLDLWVCRATMQGLWSDLSLELENSSCLLLIVIFL